MTPSSQLVIVAGMAAELKRWDAKLNELRSQGHTEGSEPNLAYHKRLDDIAAKFDAVEMKLDELKDTGSAKWETFRSSIDSAWTELGDAFRKLAN